MAILGPILATLGLILACWASSWPSGSPGQGPFFSCPKFIDLGREKKGPWPGDPKFILSLILAFWGLTLAIFGFLFVMLPFILVLLSLILAIFGTCFLMAVLVFFFKVGLRLQTHLHSVLDSSSVA